MERFLKSLSFIENFPVLCLFFLSMSISSSTILFSNFPIDLNSFLSFFKKKNNHLLLNIYN